ncbi:hypothetical protein CMU19_04485 [Elizabethkingia anophelis]|nr:hypothetical protein [Elizabethkingia anophelis]
MNYRNIIHVRFFVYSVDGEQDFYFGSLAAAFDYFNSDELGASVNSIYGSLKHDKPYITKTCIIKKGTMIRKKKASK